MTDLLASSTLTALVPALAAAQAAFGKATKDATNTHFGSGYPTLASTLGAVLPALNENGVAVVQQTHTAGDGTLMLRTTLLHSSGEWIASDYPVLPVKADPQGFGSALTYGRRYSLMALAGIAPEDDDGNAASEPTSQRAAHMEKYRSRFPRRAASEDRGPSRQPTHIPEHEVDATTARWADEIDAARCVVDLDVIGLSIRALPENVRNTLRERFKERRAALAEVERDRVELDALEHGMP